MRHRTPVDILFHVTDPAFVESTRMHLMQLAQGATHISLAEQETQNNFHLIPLNSSFFTALTCFVVYRDTLGAGFAGLGKSAAVLSQQLAQDVTKNNQGATSELQNRSEEVYSGAVDGLSSSDMNSVVEEIEHEAGVLKKAFQKALHRAMGSVALLGKLHLLFQYAQYVIIELMTTTLD